MQIIRVNEGSAAFVRFQIVDDAGEPINAQDLQAATLSVWDLETVIPGESPQTTGIINDRIAQDVLGDSSPYDVSGVEYEADGWVRWNLSEDDNPIVNPRRQVERHRAQFVFTWPSGRLVHEIEIEVNNLGLG